MNNKALLVLLGGLVVLGSFAVFVVDERERAMLLQFGEIKRSDYEPGIFFKLPFFQNVLKFDGRIQNLDSDPQLYLTSEKKNVRVDSFVKWRMTMAIPSAPACSFAATVRMSMILARSPETTSFTVRLPNSSLRRFWMRSVRRELARRVSPPVVL